MSVLQEPCTDWTKQRIHERVLLASQFLYVHGFITTAELKRIKKQREDKLEAASNEGGTNAKAKD